MTTGPKAKRFEQAFAEFLGQNAEDSQLECIAVNSATAGLHLALEALGIGPGDEVITAPNSFFASAAAIDLVGGQIRLYFATMPTISVHLQNHKVKVLGIAMAKRNPNWPDIPTVGEAGYPGYEMNSWYGLAAPAGTPRAIVDRVHAAVVRASTSPDVVERMRVLGAGLSVNTPEEFTAYIARDYERMAKAVKAAGITLE